MLKGRESEGGEACRAVGRAKASADFQNRRRSRTRVPSVGEIMFDLEVILGLSWEVSWRFLGSRSRGVFEVVLGCFLEVALAYFEPVLEVALGFVDGRHVGMGGIFNLRTNQCFTILIFWVSAIAFFVSK